MNVHARSRRDPRRLAGGGPDGPPRADPASDRRRTRTINQTAAPGVGAAEESDHEPLPRIAAAAVVIVVLLGGAIYSLGRPAAGSVADRRRRRSRRPRRRPAHLLPPSASPAPTPTATPPSTGDWLPFTSSHYGYKIAYPPTWTATQATRDLANSPRIAGLAAADAGRRLGRLRG